MTDRPTLILIAGPYRSGVDGNPQAVAADLARLEATAGPVSAAGHVPVIGECIAVSALCSAGAGAAVPSAIRFSTRLSSACRPTATPRSGFLVTPPVPSRTLPPPAVVACPSITT